MKNNRYIILLVVYMAGIAAPLNQFKVPPMMQQLMKNLDIGLATSGWLMSVFALVGVLFALPAGLIVRRIGIKTSGIIALSTLIIGSLIGVMSVSTFMLLFSRVIEGIALCLVSIIGPVAICAWFPLEKRGMPMGLWATWVPLGTILMFTIAPFLGEWRRAWIFTCIYTVVILIVFILYFKMPEKQNNSAVAVKNGSNPYKNINIWMLALVFMLFNMMTIAVKTYLPLYLSYTFNFSDLKASSVTSTLMFISIIVAPLSGLLADIVKSRKVFLTAGLIMATVSTALLFNVPSFYVFVLLIIIGTAAGMVPTATFSLSTEIMVDPMKVGIGMSIVAFGQNTGMFIGPVLFSSVAEYWSWQVAGYVMFALLLCGCVVSAAIKVDRKVK